MGAVRLENEIGVLDVAADLPSVLGLAIHLGLPIFLDAESPEPRTALPVVDIPEDSLGAGSIPPVFLKAIEDLDISFLDEGCNHKMEE